MEAMIELKDAAIGYKNDPGPVMENLNICFERGDQVALVGPNGAGKSTLLKTIVGLVPPLKGSVTVHGKTHSHKDCVSYIPQKEDIDWNYPITVREVVMMGRYGKLSLMGRPGAEDERIVDDAMRQMEITEIAERRVRDCSGGQQQRVFLARSLAQQPHILLMDEPFNGVDLTTERIILENLRLFAENGVTALVATHDLGIVRNHFKKTLLVNHELIAFGETAEVLNEENLRKAFNGRTVII